MNGGKRSFDFDGEDDQPERNRPALVSAIVDALKVDILQKLCSTMEPVLRRVVSEEVERSLANLGPDRINGRSSPKRIKGSGGRNLQLQFKSRLSLPLFTGAKVEGEQGAAIHLVLVDASTGQLVTSGPESSAKLDVVVLEGDFNNEDDEGWSLEEFESHVVKEREGKRPLLIGDLQVTLKEGVGTLGSLTFTDNSSWIRTRKFRLGLMVASGISDGTRVREAKTEAFSVKDHRGELYKKNYPPALDDEVWRLEKIGKDGPVHKRLKSAGIYTVEDFLRVAVQDAKKLRSILGSGMSDRMWDTLMEHAKTCVLSGKLYVYYPDHTRNIGAAFNDIYEFSGLISGDQYAPADSLSDGQKVFVDALVKKAYDNWDQVIEYDGPSIFKSKQTRMTTRSSTNELIAPAGFSNSVDHEPALRSFPVPGPSDLPMMQSALPVLGAGINDGPGKSVPSIFSNHFQAFSSNPWNLYGNTTLTPHVLVGNMEQNFIARSPSIPLSNLDGYGDWSKTCDMGVDDNLTEEVIRLGSHTILGNEDMQQLLQPFNSGDSVSMNMSEEGFKCPSFMPFPSSDFSFGDDHGCSGKAVVGWVKIKAAMRWGFFIRKKAAERRRAQLVEIEG